MQRGLIWAGTNDGKVWNTRDGGANWTDVTKNVTGLPAWGVVAKIEPSHFDAGTAYVAVDYHLMDSREPLLYKTTDFGADVEERDRRSAAKHPLDYTLSIAENPNRQRHALRRHRPRLLLLARRRRDTGQQSRTGCRPRR